MKASTGRKAEKLSTCLQTLRMEGGRWCAGRRLNIQQIWQRGRKLMRYSNFGDRGQNRIYCSIEREFPTWVNYYLYHHPILCIFVFINLPSNSSLPFLPRDCQYGADLSIIGIEVIYLISGRERDQQNNFKRTLKIKRENKY